MEEFKKKIAEKCAEMGISEYEIYYEIGESASVKVFQQEVNQFTSSVEGGVCFRCLMNGRMGYASTESLDPALAPALVERAVDNASVLECDDPVLLGEGGQTYAPLERQLYDLPDTQSLIAGALALQKAVYAADSGVVDGTTSQCLREKSEIGIWNSKGLDLRYVNQLAGYIVAAVVSDGAEKANDAQIRLGQLDTIDVPALAAKAAGEAREKLGGQGVATGAYPVVFSPKAMAELLNTFSGVFSAEAAQKGLSALTGKEGQTIGASLLTIMDDPFHPDNPMPMPFDSEGSPTSRKAVVEGGVLKTLLHNLKTARKAGITTTGNAAKAGYKASIGVRPFTMYIAAGDSTVDAVLRQANQGIYIDALHGTHAGTDTVSGDFSIQSTGYLIENGEKTNRIKGFTVAGNFFEVLKNITAVADDVQLPMALGKTAFGSPTVLVDGLSIAGE
ncbi:MAG: TldD/PmbA family protein [Ruminococcaceae bacterium]|nr:TldD/PmbA family protein [Oscillospiraceae bacterium]